MDAPLYAQAAQILSDTLARISRVLGDPPYNYVIHTTSFTDADNEYYHWHFEIMPKLTKVAGFEWERGSTSTDSAGRGRRVLEGGK